MMNVMRYVGGFLLTLVILPIMGLFWLGCAAYAGLTALWEQFRELWLSIAAPAFIPNIGYGGNIKRMHECSLASEDAKKGDWVSAVRHWKTAARLYDIPSMLRLGKCYETGKGVAANGGAAYEYYSLAALYGRQEGKEACLRLQDSRFPAKERKAFEKQCGSRIIAS